MLVLAFALARAQSAERCGNEDGGLCLLQLRSTSTADDAAAASALAEEEGHTGSAPEGRVTEFLAWVDGGMELAAIPPLPCAIGSTECRARLLTMAKEHACDGLPAERGGVLDDRTKAAADSSFVELRLPANQTDLQELGAEISASGDGWWDDYYAKYARRRRRGDAAVTPSPTPSSKKKKDKGGKKGKGGKKDKGGRKKEKGGRKKEKGGRKKDRCKGGEWGPKKKKRKSLLSVILGSGTSQSGGVGDGDALGRKAELARCYADWLRSAVAAKLTEVLDRER